MRAHTAQSDAPEGAPRPVAAMPGNQHRWKNAARDDARLSPVHLAVVDAYAEHYRPEEPAVYVAPARLEWWTHLRRTALYRARRELVALGWLVEVEKARQNRSGRYGLAIPQGVASRHSEIPQGVASRHSEIPQGVASRHRVPSLDLPLPSSPLPPAGGDETPAAPAPAPSTSRPDGRGRRNEDPSEPQALGDAARALVDALRAGAQAEAARRPAEAPEPPRLAQDPTPAPPAAVGGPLRVEDAIPAELLTVPGVPARRPALVAALRPLAAAGWTAAEIRAEVGGDLAGADSPAAALLARLSALAATVPPAARAAREQTAAKARADAAKADQRAFLDQLAGEGFDPQRNASGAAAVRAAFLSARSTAGA